MGIGAQFEGRYFCHDVWVVRWRDVGLHVGLDWAYLVQLTGRSDIDNTLSSTLDNYYVTMYV